MFTWKAENQELTNNHRYLGKDIVFYVEDETSLEDQIKFLDEMNNGALSYSMELVKKFNEDKKSLPKDDYGYVKTNSLKAWIRRNVDQKKLHVDND